MLYHQIARVSPSTRALLRPSVCRGVRPYSLSKGWGRDPLHQTREASKSANAHPSTATPYDAATSETIPGKKANRDGYSGNPEGIGMADQVGSQSASADKFRNPNSYEGMTGEERITPPSAADALKKKLGFKTTVGEDKQNRGGGEGVTGTGRPRFDSGKRLFSTMRPLMVDRTTKGQAPQQSRQPKERTNAEQNPHLKHSLPGSTGGKSGKGNASQNPTLPSHQFGEKTQQSSAKRTFSSSAVNSEKKPKHTAETYFKDVDSSPPTSHKTHQVDPSGTGAQVQRPNETVSGDFSQAGVQTKEYQTVDKEAPYDVPAPGSAKEQNLRYGGKPNVNYDETGNQVSRSDDGPQGRSKGGRKPERGD